MRNITSDLATVQAMRSPKATVSMTVSARGQNAEAPALEWTELVAPPASASGNPAAAVDFPDGSLFRFVAAPANLKYQHITDPTAADQWQNNAWTTAVAATADALAGYRHADAAARVYYIDTATGYVRFIRTIDSGATWLAPLNAYTGGDAAYDLCLNRTPATHALGVTFCFGFTTYTSSGAGAGTYAAYFDAGSSLKYADGWRAAGIYMREGDDDYIYCLVFRAPDLGPARLRVVRFDGATFDQPVDIDQTQAGLFGLNLAAYKFCPTPVPAQAGIALLGVALENAYMGGNYEGVAGVFWVPAAAASGLQADEPIMFPDVPSYNDRVYSYIAKSGDYYYFGETFVYRGAVQSATAQTLHPIRYAYDDHHIELELEQGAPAIAPGQIVTLRRTLSWGATSGCEDVSFYVVRVARSRRGVTLRGVDAVGYLGIARCRRPAVLNDGSATGLAQVMRRLGARFGLTIETDDSGLEAAAVMPMTVQPSESLRGAAYRMTSQANAWLVPKNDGTFAATLINPGTSDSGDYDDTAHDYPDGEWELIDAAEIADYRRLAFAYVLGTYSTDPEDGAYVGMATGPALPNTRPLSYSLTNTRYNTDERVENAALAEAARQVKLAVDAVIEAPANLALELYDMMSVTEPSLSWSAKPFRVRRIREVWEQGRLTQVIYLGEE
jgi:hypothetical protein